MLNSYLITVCKNTSFLAITSKTILSKKPPIEVLMIIWIVTDIKDKIWNLLIMF